MIKSILGFFSAVLLLSAVVILFKAETRLKDGETKKIFRWILTAFIFVILPYIFFLLAHFDLEKYLLNPDINLIIFVFMIVAGSFVMRAAIAMDQFSRKYVEK